MKKQLGLLMICLGLLGSSIVLALSRVCMYAARAGNEYQTMWGPYVEEMAIPLLLSGACIVIGITVILRDICK